jgi:hypothetical protein
VKAAIRAQTVEAEARGICRREEFVRRLLRLERTKYERDEWLEQPADWQRAYPPESEIPFSAVIAGYNLNAVQYAQLRLDNGRMQATVQIRKEREAAGLPVQATQNNQNTSSGTARNNQDTTSGPAPRSDPKPKKNYKVFSTN